MNKLSNAMSETLRDSNLHGVCTDVGEALLDTWLQDGVAKDIPILGTVYKICKTGLNISDRLFTSKLVHFLAEIANVPAADRAKEISKIESSGKYQLKVGEKLLYILEKAEDPEIARITAFLFSAFLSGELDYDDFLRGSRAVQGLVSSDLKQFVKDERDRWSIHDPAAEVLPGAGHLAFDELEIRVEDEWDRKTERKYHVEGGELSVSVSSVGKKVRDVLRSRWCAPKSAK